MAKLLRGSQPLLGLSTAEVVMSVSHGYEQIENAPNCHHPLQVAKAIRELPAILRFPRLRIREISSVVAVA